MSSLIYPDKRILEWWIEDLRGEDPLLRMKLPLVDDHWYERILEIIALVQMPYYSGDVFFYAATIFYKIAKAHNYIDGNKRSSILVLYLFCLINGYYIEDSFDARDWAKCIARSRGRSKYDWWIKRLQKELRNNATKLVIPT